MDYPSLTPDYAALLEAKHTCVVCFIPELGPREDGGVKGCWKLAKLPELCCTVL